MRPVAPAVLVALVLAAAPAQAARWEPGVRAAKRFAASRPGDVSFSIRHRGHAHGYLASRPARAASLMKPMLLAAYLRHPDVRRRPLRRDERAMLAPMIRISDDDAADRVRAIVGADAPAVIARRVGMRDYVPYARSPDGLSRTSARDQAKLFSRMPRLFGRRHRNYAMGLLRTVVPSQRWGIARAAPRGWRLYFKGGWGTVRGAPAVNHQAALLVRGRRRVALAVTITGGPSHTVGTYTIQGIARRLLRGLPRGR